MNIWRYRPFVPLLILVLGWSMSMTASAAIERPTVLWDTSAGGFAGGTGCPIPGTPRFSPCQEFVSSVAEGVARMNELYDRERFLGFHFHGISQRRILDPGGPLIHYKYLPGPSQIREPTGYFSPIPGLGVFPTPEVACQAYASEIGWTFIGVEGATIARPRSFGCIVQHPTRLSLDTSPMRTQCNAYYAAEEPDLCKTSVFALIVIAGEFPEENFGLCDGATPPPVTANPVHMVTGNKYERETDYAGASPFALRFERHYNSRLTRGGGSMGEKWRHTYERFVTTVEVGSATDAVLVRPDGREYYFVRSGTEWVAKSSVVLGELTTTASGTLEFRDAEDAVESYDSSGRLVSITSREGLVQTLAYDAEGRLDAVSDHWGRTLSFTYDGEGRIETMTDPAGGVYAYAYDGAGNLASVSYPDETPSDEADDPTRVYLYEDADFAHSLTGIVDENGNRAATWAYDEANRAILSEHAGGADRTTLVYHPDGTTSVTDALGRVRDYEFDSVGGAYRIGNATNGPCTSCGGTAQAYTYDGGGFLASETDFNGNTTTFTRDARGRETARTEAAGTPAARTVTTEWHSTLRLPVRIAAPGKVTEMTYDAQGRLLARTETDTATGRSRTVTMTYDAEGLLATRDGPRTDLADVTTFTYDAAGNLVRSVNALGHETRFLAHDAHGRPLVIEDANSVRTALAYDARGRLRSREVAGQTTRFAYDAAGKLVRVTLGDGSALAYTYDAAHRLVAITDTLGNRVAYTLDAAGNRVAEALEDPDGTLQRTQRRVYDDLGNLVQTIAGEGGVTARAYDALGNVVAVTDPNGQRTESRYDALARLIATVDPEGGTTQFAYDPRDNLTSVTDPRGLETVYTYDGFDNLVSLQSPDTGTTTYEYDAAGNRVAQTDARGVRVVFEYDALNRLTAVTYPDSAEDVRFTYDEGINGIGRLTGIVDESGEAALAYDARGNLIADVRTVAGVVHRIGYAYDAADRLVEITYPSGRVVTYHRDGAGRIVRVTATLDGETRVIADDITRAPFGPVTGFTHGNGLATERVLDADYRVAALRTPGVLDRTYSHDPAGNITEILDWLAPEADQRFGYDALDRLTEAEGIYGTLAYGYDAIGNRLAKTTDGATDLYTYDDTSNRLLAIDGPSAQGFAYDAAGNTIRKGPMDLLYNDANRLAEARQGEETLGQYVYNARGERTIKRAGGETTVFVYDASAHLLAESDPAGETGRDYIYLGDTLLAVVDREAGSAASTDGRYHLESGDGAAIDIDLADATVKLQEGTEDARVLPIVETDEPTLTADGTRNLRIFAHLVNEVVMGIDLHIPVIGPPTAESTVIEYWIRSGEYWIPEVETDVYAGPDLNTGNHAVLTVDRATRAMTLEEAGTPALDFVVAEENWTESHLNGRTWVMFYHFEASVVVYGVLFSRDDDTFSYAGFKTAGASFVSRLYDFEGEAVLVPTERLYFVHTDHLGTPQGFTNIHKAMAWEIHMTPFGIEHHRSGVLENRKRFPGQYFDQEAGLHYNYFRSYDTTTGRYLQFDPIGLSGGPHPYLYAWNNPLRFSDRHGLNPATTALELLCAKLQEKLGPQRREKFLKDLDTLENEVLTIAEDEHSMRIENCLDISDKCQRERCMDRAERLFDLRAEEIIRDVDKIRKDTEETWPILPPCTISPKKFR